MIVKLEEWVRQKFHFPALLLSKTGITPNNISITSLFLYTMAASLVALRLESWGGITAILALLVNGLDGPLARITNKSSKFGAFLDSVIDKTSEILLYIALFILFARDESLLGMLLIVLALSTSVLVSFIRARAETLGFDCEVGFINPIRMAVLSVGILIRQPIIILVIMVSLMTWTVISRFWHVWQQAES